MLRCLFFSLLFTFFFKETRKKIIDMGVTPGSTITMKVEMFLFIQPMPVGLVLLLKKLENYVMVTLKVK